MKAIDFLKTKGYKNITDIWVFEWKDKNRNMTRTAIEHIMKTATAIGKSGSMTTTATALTMKTVTVKR